MNDELLEARMNKIKSHKATILSKSIEDKNTNIHNRNTYNTLLRQSKQK
jgi:hypothetical protein